MRQLDEVKNIILDYMRMEKYGRITVSIEKGRIVNIKREENIKPEKNNAPTKSE